MNMQTAQRSHKVVLGGAAAGSRDREVTVPGRVAAPDPFPPPERRTARLLVAITGGSAVAFACIAYVGLQILLHALGGRMGDPKPECTEGTTPDGCPDGLVCMGRTCSVEPDYGPTRCDVGDPCGAKGTCTCDGALQCVADSCVQKASELPVDICEQTDVKDALKQLKVACAGNISNCPATNLQSFAINYKDFDTLIAQFPATLTVHFPGGKPPIDKGEVEWPAGTVKEFYLERIRRSAPAFREAKSVFVIARSSPGGNIVRNELFAQARSRIVKDLILDAVEYGERDTVEGKFYDFILGHKRRIDRHFFAERFTNRFITWDQKSRDRLLGLISADELSEPNDAWVTQTINQVVLIVPVPCEIK
jgi:hypothetical protein